tara:strand:- start:1710 stop:1832 length:123 start_codon:yes stop_codon:yes gene_type:complete
MASMLLAPRALRIYSLRNELAPVRITGVVTVVVPEKLLLS